MLAKFQDSGPSLGGSSLHKLNKERGSCLIREFSILSKGARYNDVYSKLDQIASHNTMCNATQREDILKGPVYMLARRPVSSHTKKMAL